MPDQRSEAKSACFTEFPLQEEIIYLNHAAVSPWPVRAKEAVCRFAEENARLGATHYPKWLEVEASLRKRLAWLINTTPEQISIQKNTSEALSTIANGVNWKAGANVVTFAQEFPSNKLVWQSLERFGVETRLVDIDTADSRNPEDALIAACDERTQLVSCSSVQYASGLRHDLGKLSEFCRSKRILFCVDAIQSLGAFEFDLEQIPADFVAADGHKWMLGPEGIALLYTNPAIRPALKINQYGWHMLKARGDFDNPSGEPSESGTRFECGSPNMLGIHALDASLSLLQELGMDVVSGLIRDNTDFLITRIDQHPRLHLLSPRDADRRSGIVTFKAEGVSSSGLYADLMKKGVICAARGNGVRFSPHFYTPQSKLQQALDTVESLISS